MEPIEYAEVLINICYGGFGFSDTFLKEFEKRYGPRTSRYEDSLRTDKRAIALFKELGETVSNGYCANLELREIPEELMECLNIEEYDGKESCSVDYSLAYCRILNEYMNRVEYREDDDPPLTKEQEDEALTTMKKKYKRVKYIEKFEWNKRATSWLKEKSEPKESL